MQSFATKKLFLFDLNFGNWQYYIFTLLFVGGNLFLPRLVHTIPLGGPRFLPIYFFVLIAAYKFGWKSGIATSVLSPLANHFLTGMPILNMLLPILVKGTAMALLAYYIAYRTNKLSLLNIALVIVGYQAIGTIFEFIYTGSIIQAFQDVVIGYPGLIIQLLGGYAMLFLLKEYGNKTAHN